MNDSLDNVFGAGTNYTPEQMEVILTAQNKDRANRRSAIAFIVLVVTFGAVITSIVLAVGGAFNG